MDECMLALMYDLPDQDNQGVTYVISSDAVRSRLPLEQITTRRAPQARESA